LTAPPTPARATCPPVGSVRRVDERAADPRAVGQIERRERLRLAL
jgi:hypothetical protein